MKSGVEGIGFGEKLGLQNHARVWKQAFCFSSASQNLLLLRNPAASYTKLHLSQQTFRSATSHNLTKVHSTTNLAIAPEGL